MKVPLVQAMPVCMPEAVLGLDATARDKLYIYVT